MYYWLYSACKSINSRCRTISIRKRAKDVNPVNLGPIAFDQIQVHPICSPYQKEWWMLSSVLK
jgi:hypothetical protein